MEALNISSTLATITDVIIGVNATNLTHATNDVKQHEVKPIDESDIFYEASFFAHLLGGLYVLCKTLNEKKCEGFSCKAQFLFAFASFLRFTHAEEAKAIVLFVPKITQLFVDVAAFIVVCVYQSKKCDRYEQLRVVVLILGCFYVSNMKVNTPYGDMVTTLSMMLDAVALLPQYIIVEKIVYLPKLVFWFVHCHFMSQILASLHAYKIYCLGYGIPRYEELCREMHARLCILVIGMIIFMNYMNVMIKGYECQLKARLDLLEANNGHDKDCPQKEYPAVLAVTKDFYNRSKKVEGEEESK